MAAKSAPLNSRTALRRSRGLEGVISDPIASGAGGSSQPVGMFVMTWIGSGRTVFASEVGTIGEIEDIGHVGGGFGKVALDRRGRSEGGVAA